MPYTHPFVYLRANGSLGDNTGTLETWSVGFKLLQTNPTVPTNSLIAFLETLATPFATFHGQSNFAGTVTYLRELTAAVVGTDGRYLGAGTQVTIRRPYPTPVAGAGVAQNPWATSIVLSLRTSVKRGRASNGRAYWPAQAVGIIPTTGLLNSSATTAISTAAATLCNSINQAADAHITDNQGIFVMSNLGEGTSAPVLAVRVGNKPDHQESRERKLVEVYQEKPVTAVPSMRADLGELPFGTVWDPFARLGRD